MKPLLGFLLAAAAFGQTFDARHDHLRGECKGQLVFDDTGVRFTSEKKDHSWSVPYLDIQQAKALDTGKFRLLTYRDRKWRLGADREYTLHVIDKGFASGIAPLLERRLDRRFVAGTAEVPGAALFELPAKHRLRISGTEGTLAAFEDRIVYRTETAGDTRTWFLSDIDQISSSDPYQFSIVTYERAQGHYGDRKGFHFQLKQPLSESRYNDLWRRLEERKKSQ